MSSDMFIISLLIAVQIFAAVTFSQYLTVDSSTTLPLLQKGTQSVNEIELNAEETFRHPAFLIHGNPILGYFHRSPGHRAMARLPTGTYLTYSPPLSPILRPVPGHLSRSPDAPSPVSELPSSWSPLVANGDKSTSNEVGFDENKSEESRSDASPARPSVEASPPPQFLYPQRPMLPYRHPGYISHSGIPTRGFGTIDGNVNSEPVPKEIKETIRSVETSDEVKSSEALAKANFIQTNWIALITSMILLALAALGVVGYFVWKGRIGDTSIPPPPVPRQSS